MSSEGRRHGAIHIAAEWTEGWAREAGKCSTLAVPHPMLPPHVDKLGLVVNKRITKGQLRGYDGPCKADGHLIQRTFIEAQYDVKGEDGVVVRQDTRLDIVPTAYRDTEAR